MHAGLKGVAMANSASQPTVATILIIDDDRSIRDLLSRSLTSHGYHVFTASNTGEMDAVIAAESIDLLILDIMMPGEDGLSAAGRLVQAGAPPIIFLSALGEVEDRITGLNAGASHYLPKPCSSREILATVRAALRQRDVAEPAISRTYMFAGWRIDFAAHELFDPEGVLVDLTDGEFAVLRAFVERPKRVLARDALLEAARGPDSASFDRAIDVQVSRLRRKLRTSGDELIRTIRNEGYLFNTMVERL